MSDDLETNQPANKATISDKGLPGDVIWSRVVVTLGGVTVPHRCASFVYLSQRFDPNLSLPSHLRRVQEMK